MTIFKNELRQNRISFWVWSGAIAFMLGVVVLLYPQMESQMDAVGESMAEMGSFSAAFGLDRLNFGEFSGYFGVEFGNIMTIGGMFFAALLGIGALAKEEKEHTAEFLLTHPVSRCRVLTEKFTAILVQLAAMNVIVLAVLELSMVFIGEELDMHKILLLFVGYFLMEIQVAAVTFGISAFLSKGSMSVGLGLAAGLYFLNIVSNIQEDAEVLKYITPLGYADSAYILNEGRLQGEYLTVGMILLGAGIVAAYVKYTRKDIS